MTYFAIGDQHGCISELELLLGKLGFVADLNALQGDYKHPQGHKVIFCGDGCDRGPNSVAVFKLIMRMCKSGNALAVLGNHCEKLHRALKGNKVTLSHGLAETMKQIELEPQSFRDELLSFLANLPFEILLEGCSISHAGLPEHLQGKDNAKARSHALYGDVKNGEKDVNGFPIRRDWAQDYKGERVVIHGHVPVREPKIVNKVYNIDTGCCFGGYLTALEIPSMTITQVKALKEYMPYKPFGGVTTNGDPG